MKTVCGEKRGVENTEREKERKREKKKDRYCLLDLLTCSGL